MRVSFVKNETTVDALIDDKQGNPSRTKPLVWKTDKNLLQFF